MLLSHCSGAEIFFQNDFYFSKIPKPPAGMSKLKVPSSFEIRYVSFDLKRGFHVAPFGGWASPSLFITTAYLVAAAPSPIVCTGWHVRFIGLVAGISPVAACFTSSMLYAPVKRRVKYMSMRRCARRGEGPAAARSR